MFSWGSLCVQFRFTLCSVGDHFVFSWGSVVFSWGSLCVQLGFSCVQLGISRVSVGYQLGISWDQLESVGHQ